MCVCVWVCVCMHAHMNMCVPKHVCDNLAHVTWLEIAYTVTSAQVKSVRTEEIAST